MVEAALWTAFVSPNTALLVPPADIEIDLFSFDPDQPQQLPGRFFPCSFSMWKWCCLPNCTLTQDHQF